MDISLEKIDLVKDRTNLGYKEAKEIQASCLTTIYATIRVKIFSIIASSGLAILAVNLIIIKAKRKKQK